jgi:hypothetical protein
MTKRHLACPTCRKDTASERLKFGGKSCYMAHCRFLRQGHIWHIKKIKKIKKKKKKKKKNSL